MATVADTLDEDEEPAAKDEVEMAMAVDTQDDDEKPDAKDATPAAGTQGPVGTCRVLSGPEYCDCDLNIAADDKDI